MVAMTDTSIDAMCSIFFSCKSNNPDELNIVAIPTNTAADNSVIIVAAIKAI